MITIDTKLFDTYIQVTYDDKNDPVYIAYWKNGTLGYLLGEEKIMLPTDLSSSIIAQHYQFLCQVFEDWKRDESTKIELQMY